MSSSSEYDDIGDFLTSVTDGRGIVTNYEYDTLKELLTSTNVNNNRVYRYLYDTKDRITKVYLDRDKDSVVDSTDEAVSYAYNSKGYLTSLTTPNSGTYTIAYDNFGNTSSIKAGSFTLAQYVYNANNGKLNKTTYGNGFYTENVYDELDRIIQIKYNGVVKYSFKYNGDGQLYSATDVPNNAITYYEYDSNGRLLRARLKENTTSGSVLLNTENKFDNLGRAVKSVYDLQKLGEKMTYTVTYKGNSTVTSGRIASFTLPSSHSISYSYDSFDRMTQKQLFIGTGAIPTEKFEYYTANNKTVGLVTSHTINVNNYMNNPQSQVIYNYTYDDYGNILTVSEGATLKLSYTYDDLNQLTRENNAYANKTYVYTYDKNGNILTKKTYAYTTGTLGSVQNTVNYTYGNSSWKDLLTNYNGTAISYDGSGNPTNWRGSITSLIWNGRQLNTLRYGSNTYTYTYNSDGIRTQKALVYDGISMTSFTHYILDGTKVVAQYQTTTSSITPSNIIYFYYDESGSPTGMKYNGNVYFFQKNLQGDIIRILNTQGSIVATYTYDAWGNIIASTDTSGVSIGTKNPFRYRGYYYDTETGLYYLNSRYYDPQVGRFLNADGLVSTGQGLLGNNMFAYCLNNPVVFSDSSGMTKRHVMQKEIALIACGGAAIVGRGILLGIVDFIGDFCSDIWKGLCNLVDDIRISNSNASSSEKEEQKSPPVVGSTPATPPLPPNNNDDDERYNFNGRKDRNYIEKRGWTDEKINNAINNGKQGISKNMENNNICSVYRYPGIDNQYVVIDDVTKSIVQVSDFKDMAWVVDSRIMWFPQ